MTNTIELLERALQKQPAQHWHQKLDLNRNALHNARIRGHLSPAIAGELAAAMGEDWQKWTLIAAAESERDSACKTRLTERLKCLLSQ